MHHITGEDYDNGVDDRFCGRLHIYVGLVVGVCHACDTEAFLTERTLEEVLEGFNRVTEELCLRIEGITSTMKEINNIQIKTLERLQCPPMNINNLEKNK